MFSGIMYINATETDTNQSLLTPWNRCRLCESTHSDTSTSSSEWAAVCTHFLYGLGNVSDCREQLILTDSDWFCARHHSRDKRSEYLNVFHPLDIINIHNRIINCGSNAIEPEKQPLVFPLSRSGRSLTLVTATFAPLLMSWTTLSAWPLCEAMRRRSESARTSAASCWLMKWSEWCAVSRRC